MRCGAVQPAGTRPCHDRLSGAEGAQEILTGIRPWRLAQIQLRRRRQTELLRITDQITTGPDSDMHLGQRPEAAVRLAASPSVARAAQRPGPQNPRRRTKRGAPDPGGRGQGLGLGRQDPHRADGAAGADHLMRTRHRCCDGHRQHVRPTSNPACTGRQSHLQPPHPHPRPARFTSIAARRFTAGDNSISLSHSG